MLFTYKICSNTLQLGRVYSGSWLVRVGRLQPRHHQPRCRGIPTEPGVSDAELALTDDQVVVGHGGHAELAEWPHQETTEVRLCREW